MPPDEDLDLDQPSEETEENEAWDEFEDADDGDSDDPEEPVGHDDDLDDEGEDTPPEEEDAPADEAGAEEDPDLWQGATPAQVAAHKAAQEQLKKLEQSDRSNRGRLSAMQRQLNELNARATKPVADKGQTDDAEGAMDEWKQFETEYPEIAKPFASIVQRLEAHIAKQDKVLQSIGDDKRTEALMEQESLLAKEHEDWQDVTAEPGFVEWIYSQPRHIQEAAQRNAQEIVDAAEAIDLVGRYKQLRSQSSGTRTTQDDSRDTSGTETNRPLNSRRQRQINSARGAKSRSAAVTSGIPEDGDPEKLWDQFEKMERRQR